MPKLCPACSFNAIKEKKGLIYVEPELCVDCQACRESCPTNCFSILDEASAREAINRLFAHSDTEKTENPKENPSQNPSDKNKDKGDSSKTESSQDKSESSTSDKDTQNDTDKSDEKSESSKSDSSTKSEFIPTPPPQRKLQAA
ncbi:4Fe-4S binding protein [Helicobacter sp. T3_23-1056]